MSEKVFLLWHSSQANLNLTQPWGSLRSVHASRDSALRAWVRFALPVALKEARYHGCLLSEERTQRVYTKLKRLLVREKYEAALEHWNDVISDYEASSYFYIIEQSVQP